jgi:hypothetical protein
MQRRAFFAAAGSAVLAPALLAQSAATSSVAPSSAPVLHNVTGEGVDVAIAVGGLATGWVEFGETAALGFRADLSSAGLRPMEDRVLRCELRGLRPGRSYHYRFVVVPLAYESPYRLRRGEPMATATHVFRTLDPAAEHAEFTVWNDTHAQRETVSRLVAAQQAAPGDFLVWNGDVTNDLHDEELLVREHLNPAGLPFAANTPLFLGRGNHDVRGRAARLLPKHLPGPGGAYHHVVRQGPLACLFLDTGEDKPDEVAAYAGLTDFAAYREHQRRWLEGAIESPAFREAPFRIAVMHIPLWWDEEVPENWRSVWGGHAGWVCEDGRRRWHDLLVRAGIRFVVSGHTHRHRWFPANAAHPYGQLIGGGPKPEEAASIRIRATRRRLSFEVRDLAGRLVRGQEFGA